MKKRSLLFLTYCLPLMLLFVLSCFHRQQHHAESLTTAGTNEPKVDIAALGDGILITGELLSLPAEVLAQLDKDQGLSFANGSLIDPMALQALEKKSSTQIILRPRLLIRDGEEGSFNVNADDNHTPKILIGWGVKKEEGRIQLKSKINFQTVDGKQLLQSENELLPNNEQYLCLRGLSDGQREVLVLVRVYAKMTVL